MVGVPVSGPFNFDALLGNPEKMRELETENGKLRDLIGDYSARLRRIIELCEDDDRHFMRSIVKQIASGGPS